MLVFLSPTSMLVVTAPLYQDLPIRKYEMMMKHLKSIVTYKEENMPMMEQSPPLLSHLIASQSSWF